MKDLHTLAADLEAANEDLALLERLKSAKDRVARLSKDYEKAKAAHDKEEAEKAEAAREARFAGISDLRVTNATDPRASAGGNLLRQSFRVSWMQPSYDMHTQRSIPKQRIVNGFGAVPDKVLSFLIERSPEQIPAEIMALAPGNPERAFERYFGALRRGYMTGAEA